MSDSKYNVDFEKLCNRLQLGDMVGVPEALSGGLLHKMFAVQTTHKKYAVKALNPQIMCRSTAIQNFIRSERIANIAAKTISALPAKIYDGTSIQKVDNQFYLIFNWIDGECLKPGQVNSVHCHKIGASLADLHMTDFTELGLQDDRYNNPEIINWNYYLQKGQVYNSGWVNLMLESMDQLYEWNVQANQSTRVLSSEKVISHGDLEPKNVIWGQNHYVIIDWESAGYINPMQDLIETAIYWSKDEKGNLDKDKFWAFLNGYKKNYKSLQADWGMVLNSGFLSKLGWLEYSLKRSLWIECTDKDEQRVGTAQVTGTLHEIRRYADQIMELENWLNKIDHTY